MGSCGSPRPDLILCTNRDHRASIIGLQPPIGIGTGFQLAPGRPAVVATWGRALLREDAGLHAYQMLEAGVRQFGEWGNTGTSLENVRSQLRSLRQRLICSARTPG